MSSGGRDSSRFPVGGGFLRGLPFWLGAVIVSFVPTKTLSTIDFVLAPPQGIGNLIFDDALFLSLIMLYFLYAMRYITRRIDRLGEYVKDMSLGNTALHLGTSYRLSRVFLIWIILLGIITLLSPIPATIEKVALEQIPVFAYFFLILALFLWTYGSSMLAIYRAGRLPFQLRPFTEDRTFGWRALTRKTLWRVSSQLFVKSRVTFTGFRPGPSTSESSPDSQPFWFCLQFSV